MGISLDVYLFHTLSLCLCAFNRLSVSYDIKAQGEVYGLVLQSCKHSRQEAPHKLACNSLTHSTVHIYRVASDRLVEFVSFFNIIKPTGKGIK